MGQQPKHLPLPQAFIHHALIYIHHIYVNTTWKGIIISTFIVGCLAPSVSSHLVVVGSGQKNTQQIIVIPCHVCVLIIKGYINLYVYGLEVNLLTVSAACFKMHCCI